MSSNFILSGFAVQARSLDEIARFSDMKKTSVL